MRRTAAPGAQVRPRPDALEERIPVEKTVINPPGTFASVPLGFSQAVKVRASGALIFVAGQGPLDDAGRVVGAGDIDIQARAAFANVARVLAAAGSSFGDVVKMVVYCSDIDNQRAAIRKVRGEFADRKHPPVSTMIEVAKFAEPGMLIEIDVTAAVS
jgi:enamine deaminase RidA (YjgF/YER057c/UK114 family)